MKKVIDFLVNEYGVDRNTAATLTISIFIFLLGIIATVITNSIIGQIKRNFYKRSLRLIIRNFFKSCEKQYKIHKESITEYAFMHGNDFVFKIVPNPSHTYLSSINISEFIINFYSFLNRKRPKIITKLFEIVDSVKLANEIQKINSEKINERYSIHESCYYKNLDELRKLNDEVINKASTSNIKSDPAYLLMNKIFSTFKNWQDTGGLTIISNTYKMIVLPLLEESRKSEPNPYNQQVIDYCLQCDISYINMEKLDKIFRENLKDLAHVNKRAFKIGKIIIKSI